jgi:hypothetical protein
MIIDDLMALLEGCLHRAEVRIAVKIGDGPPLEAAILGITSSNRLPPAHHVPGQGDPEPDVVWVLSGEPLGTVTADHWKPEYRRGR